MRIGNITVVPWFVRLCSIILLWFGLYLIIDSVNKNTALPFSVLASGAQLGQRGSGDYVTYPELGEPELMVLTSQDDFQEFLRQLSINQERPFPNADAPPTLNTIAQTDFQNYTVVVAFHGYHASGGSSIQITQVNTIGNTIFLKADLRNPGEIGGVPVISDPFTVIQIPRPALGQEPITFSLWKEWGIAAETRRYITIP